METVLSRQSLHLLFPSVGAKIDATPSTFNLMIIIELPPGICLRPVRSFIKKIHNNCTVFLLMWFVG